METVKTRLENKTKQCVAILNININLNIYICYLKFQPKKFKQHRCANQNTEVKNSSKLKKHDERMQNKF